MVDTRYDLTAKIAPFLDPLLFRQIEEFNGVSVAPLKGGAPASAAPSLDAASALYEAGDFAAASKMLSSLKFDSASDEYEKQAWGKLAADLLAFPEPPKPAQQKTAETKSDEDTPATEEEQAATPEPAPSHDESDPVIKALANVQELLDQRRTSGSTVQLNRRAWLIHWSLFAYFDSRIPKLVDTFFMSQYMSVIQAACPWVLRYVVVAVVVSHPRTARFNRRVKDAIRVVQQELYEYSDAVLEFIQALYIDYDFESAAEKLNKATECLKNDYFAHRLVDQFAEKARILIADSYLRVHEYVSADDLVATLGLAGSGQEPKKWISEYITAKQEAKLDASYDEAKNIVRVTYTKPSVNSQVLEKVKTMDQRAYQLQQFQNKKTEA